MFCPGLKGGTWLSGFATSDFEVVRFLFASLSLLLGMLRDVYYPAANVLDL